MKYFKVGAKELEINRDRSVCPKCGLARELYADVCECGHKFMSVCGVCGGERQLFHECENCNREGNKQ